MKILVVGDWHSKVHEEAVFQAFLSLGHSAEAFPWHRYFVPTPGILRKFDWLSKKAQNKYLVGPLIWRINRDLLEVVKNQNFDFVFVYRGTHIWSSTLKSIKKAQPNTILIGYNNDDPLSPKQPRWAWRHFLSSIPCYDLVLAYRTHNLKEYLDLGAKKVQLLRSWFIPETNKPVMLNDADKSKFACDIVFIGHYETDGRDKIIESIIKEGWSVRLFGPNGDWDQVVASSDILRSLAPVLPVWGNEYSKALCGARIALCFFSKLNRDTYTRRCFEIPATGTMMLSEYSEDLAGLLKEGEEVEFFRNETEILEKIQIYLRDEQKRLKLAERGRRRILEDGHDVVSRMKQVVSWVSDLRKGV